MALAVIPDQFGDGRCDVRSRGDRGLHIHDQDRVVAGIVKQRLQRHGIARGIGITDDIDGICAGPCRRQRRVESLADVGRDRRRGSSEFDQPVDGEHADAAAIGEDREPLSRRRVEPPQGLGAVEQFAEIADPQNAGATERGVVDRIRTGERAGVGRGGFRALRHAAGFHHHDRLDPRGGAACGHEFARVLDRLDIEQDRPGLAVARVVIEQIGDIDIELIADRQYPGEANPALRGPVHHAGRNRA